MTKRQRIKLLEQEVDVLIRSSNTSRYAAANEMRRLEKRVEELELRFGYVTGQQ